MRFMIIVRATTDSEAGVMPPQSMFDEMGAFHEELHKAGVLVAADGLQPSSKGWRIEYRGSERAVVDGPFPETKELIAGFTIIDVASRDEALAWSKRFPKPHLTDGSIEVRQIYELEDFEPAADVERFRELGREINAQREAK